MPKVTLVGAGSAVFARQLITDILAMTALMKARSLSSTSIPPAWISLAGSPSAWSS